MGHDEHSDFDLLAQWRDGDAAAGDALFRRHFDTLNRFFRSKLPEDTADLIQRVWLVCLEKREGIDGRSFRSYLLGVARLELFSGLRRRSRAAAIDGGVDSLMALTGSPSGAAAAKQQSKQLLAALPQLPLDLQILLELHYWDKLTTHELAGVLAIPVGTVKSRLQRARARLSELMQDPDLVALASAAATEDLDRPGSASPPRDKT